jgi:hypothetical protein
LLPIGFKSQFDRAAFTVCARNYFAQALLLEKSFRLRNPGYDFHIVLMDRRDEVFASRFPSINIIWVEDIGLPHFHANALRFDVIEFSTNVKPHCLSLFLNIYQKVLYLDPDTFVFDTLAPVYNELDHHSIVMTPASMTPVLDGHRPDDIEWASSIWALSASLLAKRRGASSSGGRTDASAMVFTKPKVASLWIKSGSTLYLATLSGAGSSRTQGSTWHLGTSMKERCPWSTASTLSMNLQR